MKLLIVLLALCQIISLGRRVRRDAINEESASDNDGGMVGSTLDDRFDGSSLIDESGPNRMIVGVNVSAILGEYPDLGWMTIILKRIWPKTGPAIWNFVETDVNPMLSGSLPFPLNRLQVQKFTLDSSPEVGPVKIYESADGDGFKVLLHIKFESSSPIVLSGAAGINSLRVEGDLVMHIAPIIDQIPVIGGVTMYFLDPPDLEIEFQGLAKAAAFPGAAGLVRSIINKAIGSAVVLPNVIGIPIADESKGVSKSLFKSPRPIGIARVTIHEAKLSGNSSSPYVMAELGDESWSAPPAVNHLESENSENVHNFLIYDQMQRIRFTVWEKYWFSSSLLGMATVPLSQAFAHNGNFGTFQLWDKEDMSTAGSLEADVRHLQMHTCSDEYNGVVIAVTIQSITLPSGSPTSARVALKIGDSWKTTHMGEITKKSGVSQLQRDVIARCHQKGMPADQIAWIAGCEIEQVQSVIEVIRALRGKSANRITLELDRRFYFALSHLDFSTLSMDLKIVGKDKKQLGAAVVDLFETGLLNGLLSDAGCNVQKHLVVNGIEVNFDVSLFSLEDKFT